MNKEILPVLDEISAILKKHDMAGLSMVANKTHVDYRIEISPSWSCARLETDGQGNIGIRVRSKLADYPSKEAQRESMTQTIGTFVTFDHIMSDVQTMMLQVLKMLAQKIDFLGKSTREG